MTHKLHIQESKLPKPANPNFTQGAHGGKAVKATVKDRNRARLDAIIARAKAGEVKPIVLPVGERTLPK